jgi:hypothetical protein
MMKTLQHLFVRVSSKDSLVCRQMEFSLPGSRLTRDEAQFLRNLRRIREQLAESRT